MTNIRYDIFDIERLLNFADLSPTGKNFHKLNFPSWAYVKCFAPARFPIILNLPKKNTWIQKNSSFFSGNRPLVTDMSILWSDVGPIKSSKSSTNYIKCRNVSTLVSFLKKAFKTYLGSFKSWLCRTFLIQRAPDAGLWGS